MKSVEQILEEFDERFTEKDAIGVGRWWQERIAPSFVRNFLRSYLNQMLDELEMEERSSKSKLPGEWGIALEKNAEGYNHAAREQNRKIKKLRGEETK